MSPLIPASALFRFRIPCLAISKQSSSFDETRLSDRFRLPAFSELDGIKPFADVRMGWTKTTLVWQVTVKGKQKPLWCREGRAEESDGLHIWLDTRDTKNVQRATQFCHRFAFLPGGRGTLRTDPVAAQIWMAQARAHPQTVEEESWQIAVNVQPSGYQLTASIELSALTGFESLENSRLGFFYEVIDAEHGRQTLSLSPDLYRFAEDPSLWATLELVDKSRASAK